MKKILFPLLTGLFLSVSSQAADKWVEGTHYQVLAKPATAKPEVMEFFSFWCPACYRFESLIGPMKEKLGKDVAFKKVHVNFMGATSPEVQDEATQAMMMGKALKREEAINRGIFNLIHVQRKPVTGLEDLKSLFIAEGVNPDKVDAVAKSFSVNSLTSRNKTTLAKYRSAVNSVPTFIVNGKYKATFTRDMNTDQIIELIVWLSQQK